MYFEFKQIFRGWTLVDHSEVRDFSEMKTVKSCLCRHKAGYETTFTIEFSSDILAYPSETEIVSQIMRQMALFKRSIYSIPSEAVSAPEVQEDEEPEWTPELIQSIWMW